MLFVESFIRINMDELYFSQAFWQHQTRPIAIPYEHVIILILKWIMNSFSCNAEELLDSNTQLNCLRIEMVGCPKVSLKKSSSIES
jgi:hypothetical protein